jgi:hypothetical protein
MLAAVIVLAVLLVLAIAVLLIMGARERSARRSEELHERFGPEYDRTLNQTGSRRDAERELADRTERYEKLQIRPLDAMQREAYAASWRNVQARFVDAPREAVADADALVRDVMTERGYPMGDFERQSADLSVEHADVVGHYRAAHDIRTRDADREVTTEELREAMVHYRALFDSLLAPAPSSARATAGPR